ncbi:MAG: fumarylacetoacetate hydrolase family protein [Opitutales bacterium]|nr:fumarylacetoacetate hydrolase family protein [Opitutales bacterium]
MKLIRYGKTGQEKTGVIIGEISYDTSGFGEDYDEVFFASDGIKRLSDWISANDLKAIDSGVRLGPPVARPSKIVCIGLNYRLHAIESGMEIPKEPVVFFKATSAIVGPNDDMILPKDATKADWEVELAVVIGKKASYVSEENALDYVGGYLVMNDYSERAFQLERGGNWVKGKSCDTFAPLGPFLATPDEIEDVHDLNLWLKLNGETVQNSNTSDFIFNIPKVISYLSNFMSLLPGDVISTGTPSGVGMGMTPPRYLQAGDVVELGIDGLGSSRQVVKGHH